MKYLALLLTAACASAHTDHFDQPGRSSDYIEGPGFSAAMEAGWFNRYLLEGREVFGTSGIFTTLLSASYDNLAVELWTAFSDSSSERELEASLLYSMSDAPLKPVFGITYITDTRDWGDNWDLSLGVGDELILGVEWNAAFTYGIAQTGGYIETGVLRSFALAGFESTLGAHLGTNLGYVEDGHKGPDHYAFRLEVSREILADLTLTAALAHYTPIQRNQTRHPDDGDLYEGYHFGIALERTF